SGEQLRKTDFETLFSVGQLTGMGLVELVGNLKNLWRAFQILKRALKERRPSLLVLIDFPEFNLRLARIAKSIGVPVLYYISPQIWAWRRGRVKQIARWVDHMAVVFPFEVEFYHRHGVKVSFVGHPLVESVHASQNRESVFARIGLNPSKPTIALMPGSRRGEVDFHLPVMREAARQMATTDGIQFFCVRASTINQEKIAAYLQMPIVDSDRYDALHAADLVWTASGTATLETALLETPMIVIYRMSWLTYWVARLLVRVDHIGMVNLIAGERLVPELVQNDVNPVRLVAESRGLLNDAVRRRNIVAKLAQLRARLGAPGAAGRVADIALGMIA
ncbi:MAG TPA: lipid-A-disaccharide synthase, partial [Candidatus Binatus sp.]|nr:lipid-A-disaccharide synthase [Candidatus Binatus sp.]